MKENKSNQESCSHEKVSDWMANDWASESCKGKLVKVCSICKKVVAEKTVFGDCGLPTGQP